MKKVRKYPYGGKADSTYSRNIVNKAFAQYPILNTLGSQDKFNVIAATGKDQQHLDSMGRRLEYFAPNEDWYPLYDDTTQKQPIPYKGTYRTMIDTAGQSPQQVQDAVGLDFVSHALHNNPQYQQFNQQLDSNLKAHYGQKMVQGNGGADAYIRGHLSNSPEYQPYKDEMKFLPGNYFAPLDSMIQQKEMGGYLNNSLNSNNFKVEGPYMKKKMQQGGMYWDGKKYVPTKGTGTYQQGMYFANGGYTDANAPQLYTANGMSQWQGQGIDFRSPNPYAPQMPIMSKPMMPQMPLMGGGDGQTTYGNYGQGYGPEPVGKGAAGDVFANAHGYRDGGKVPMNYKGNSNMKQQINGPYHNGYNLPDPNSYNDSTVQQYTGNPGVNQQMMNKYLPQKPWNTPNPQQDWMQEGFNPHNTDADRYQFKGGGIHIKPQNRGKFTAYKERTGKTTEEALHSPDPHVRQMANFARNAKKWHHQFGGPTMPQYDSGGGYMNNAWTSANPQDDITTQMYEQRANTQDVVQNSPIYGQQQPMVTGNQPEGMTPMDNNIVPGQQAMQQPIQYTQQRPFGTGTKNLLGAGLLAAGYFADRKNEKDRAQRAMQNGMTSMYGINPLDAKGNYNQQGTFRPQQRGYSNPGMYYPPMKMGGNIPQYAQGGVYEMDPVQAQMLQKLGYKFEIIP